MRISDWSSDVCSSDLAEVPASGNAGADLAAGKPQVGVSAAGVQAVERVKQDPIYQRIAGSAAEGARDAAAQSGAVPTAPLAGQSPVRAAAFPSSDDRRGG